MLSPNLKTSIVCFLFSLIFLFGASQCGRVELELVLGVVGAGCGALGFLSILATLV